MIPHRDLIIVTRFDDDHEGDGEKYSTSTLPKHYRSLYIATLRIVEKIKKKVVQYTIIRTRQLDPRDRVICDISLTGSYTLYLPNDKKAVLKHINDSDIMLYTPRSTRSVPFQYDPHRLRAITFDDAFNDLRSAMHEMIQCKEQQQQQRIKKGNHAKTWTVEWNVDSGIVTDLKQLNDAKRSGKCSKSGKSLLKSLKSLKSLSTNHGVHAEEGLYRDYFESDSTLQSDYSECNSEFSYDANESIDLTQEPAVKSLNGKSMKKSNPLKRENLSLSTVDSSMHRFTDDPNGTGYSNNTIRSEASWRKCKDKKEDNDSQDLLDLKTESDTEQISKEMTQMTLNVKTQNCFKTEIQKHQNELMKWTRRNVVDWLKCIGVSRGIGKVFWDCKVDGKVLSMMDERTLNVMFANISEDMITDQEIDSLFDKVIALQRQYLL